MVMLNRNAESARSVRIAERVLCAEIVRVEIVSDDLGLDAEEAREVFNALLESGEGLNIFQIANVLAEESVAVAGEADCVFQFATHGEKRRRVVRKMNGRWGVAARTAHAQ